MKRFKILALVAIASIISLNFSSVAQAANPADWHAGNIIDDAVFYNKNAMDVTSIQNFLNSKVPNCDSWGTQPYGNGTRADYSRANGQPLPMVCLKDYYENPSTHANNLDGNPIPGGALSAAQLISAAAQNYNINPQVLLVLVQKEQGLVTDDWPWDIQYRSAAGYGCPDSNVCNSQYYGFFNQINNAARQFRLYANNPNNYNYVPGMANNILYSPSTGCGTASIYIQNLATAGLYNYTPYTPNQAAINNLYGTGDGCSSYGNRNFWRYFVDWFGATYINYSWQTVSQGAYFDSGKQMPANLGQLVPGQRYYLTVTIRNNGNVTWDQTGSNPIILATSGPQDRASPFCDSTWTNTTSCNRVTTMRENTVAPGQNGTFEFWVTAPNTIGQYNELYTPVMVGMSWMPGSFSFPMYVGPTYYGASLLGQAAYTDSTKQTGVDLTQIVPGKRYYITETVRNTGNIIWNNSGSNPTVLAGPNGRQSPFCDSTWTTCNRAAYLDQATTYPGQTGTFSFWITTPNPGSYTEIFKPVMEGKSWFDTAQSNFNIRVEPYTWALQDIRVYNDNSKSTLANINSLDPGQRYYMVMYVQNLGWAQWTRNGANPFTIATAGPDGHNSTWCDATWTDCSRAGILHENTINGGQTGTVEFWFDTPQTSGTYSEQFKPMIDGTSPTRLGTDSINVTLHTNQPQLSWQIISQGAYTDSTKTTPFNLGNVQAGQRYYLTMTLKNTSNTTWFQGTNNPMHLATVTPRDRHSAFCDSTWINNVNCNRANALHETSVAPGQYGSFEFWVTAPNTPGTYNEIFAPVIAGIGWMDDHTASFPMIVH